MLVIVSTWALIHALCTLKCYAFVINKLFYWTGHRRGSSRSCEHQLVHPHVRLHLHFPSVPCPLHALVFFISHLFLHLLFFFLRRFDLLSMHVHNWHTTAWQYGLRIAVLFSRSSSSFWGIGLSSFKVRCLLFYLEKQLLTYSKVSFSLPPGYPALVA